MANIIIQPSLSDEIKSAQKDDPYFDNIRKVIYLWRNFLTTMRHYMEGNVGHLFIEIMLVKRSFSGQSWCNEH